MLPTEILSIIVLFLDIGDIPRIRESSSLLREIVESSYFWKKKLGKHYKEESFCTNYSRYKKSIRIRKDIKRGNFHSNLFISEEEALSLFSSIISPFSETLYLAEFARINKELHVRIKVYPKEHNHKLIISQEYSAILEDDKVHDFFLNYNYDTD